MHVHKGWFEDTLPTFSAPPIAVLRIDGDWYESTMTCLSALWDAVVPGGLVLLDDYGSWEGCTKAMHDFLSERKAVEFVQERRSAGRSTSASADATSIGPVSASARWRPADFLAARAIPPC